MRSPKLSFAAWLKITPEINELCTDTWIHRTCKLKIEHTESASFVTWKSIGLSPRAPLRRLCMPGRFINSNKPT